MKYIFHKLKNILCFFMVTLLFFNSPLLHKSVQAKAATSSQPGFEAAFFLYNPNEYIPRITNVSPAICTYIGGGRVTSKSAIYNNPEEVTSRVIQEPDYKNILDTHYSIEWSTIYTYKKYLVVIGRYTTIKNPISTQSYKLTTSKTIPPIISPIELGRLDLFNTNKSSYPSGTYVKWKDFSNWGYKNDVDDGIIPIELIDDPIYCSMNFPSEALSAFSESVDRDNAHIINKLTPTQTTAVGIGAIYLANNQQINRDFTLCLGKIGLYAFSKSQNKWIVIDEQNTCKGLKMYQLPWNSGIHYQCDNITYYDDHVEIKIGKDEIANRAFHFWGVRKPIDQSDYLYYATAYQVWVKEGSASWRLTTEGGIDAKDNDANNTIQLVSSRSLALTTTPKTCWCHTIPNLEYDYNRDFVQLNQLFNR